MQDVWVSYFVLSWRVTEWHPLVWHRNLPFCKMLWQLNLSIVGFSSRLCGIIDLSSASSSTIPFLLLSRRQFIKHHHLFFSFFFASANKGCQMWRFQYYHARLDRDKCLTSLGTVFSILCTSMCSLGTCSLQKSPSQKVISLFSGSKNVFSSVGWNCFSSFQYRSSYLKYFIYLYILKFIL